MLLIDEEIMIMGLGISAPPTSSATENQEWECVAASTHGGERSTRSVYVNLVQEMYQKAKECSLRHSVEQCFISVQTTLYLNARYVEVESVTPNEFFKNIFTISATLQIFKAICAR